MTGRPFLTIWLGLVATAELLLFLIHGVIL